jgi:hypothetical protein
VQGEVIYVTPVAALDHSRGFLGLSCVCVMTVQCPVLIKSSPSAASLEGKGQLPCPRPTVEQ